MNFEDFFWPDSQLQKIEIEYNCAKLFVWSEALQKTFVVLCSGFVGITNLCIWDDTIIANASMQYVHDSANDFVRNLYEAYDRDYDYGGRSLNNGLIELKIELINTISCSLYCQKVEINNTGDGSLIDKGEKMGCQGDGSVDNSEQQSGAIRGRFSD